jgi:hypothetical protein
MKKLKGKDKISKKKGNIYAPGTTFIFHHQLLSMKSKYITCSRSSIKIIYETCLIITLILKIVNENNENKEHSRISQLL